MAVDAQVLAPPSAGAAARHRARRNSSAPVPRSGRAPCRGRARGCCPAVGISRPSSMAMVVVLPAPLPPSRPTVAPAGTAKSMDPPPASRRSAWSGAPRRSHPCAAGYALRACRAKGRLRRAARPGAGADVQPSRNQSLEPRFLRGLAAQAGQAQRPPAIERASAAARGRWPWSGPPPPGPEDAVGRRARTRSGAGCS